MKRVLLFFKQNNTMSQVCKLYRQGETCQPATSNGNIKISCTSLSVLDIHFFNRINIEGQINSYKLQETGKPIASLYHNLRSRPAETKAANPFL